LIKGNILNATTFLVTQADPKSKFDNIKNVMENLRDSLVGSMTEAEKNRFQ
jgi:hypothetical protein